MQFACSGKLILLQASVSQEYDAVELVELGLCCLSRSTVSKRARAASAVSVTERVALAEPLVVEAAMRKLPWAKLAASKMNGAVNNTNESGRGVAFESCVVPVVDSVFSGADLQKQAFLSGVDVVPGALEGPWQRGQSACAVLILPCPDDAVLEVWMRDSRSARFDGQCAPLATPNKMFGADVLVPLRKRSEFPAFCWALFQLKYAKYVNVDKALLTVDPELIHHIKREERKQKASPAFQSAYKAMFDGAEVAERMEPVIRVLVHYQTDPKKRKTNSSGKVVVRKKPKLEDLIIDLDPVDTTAAVESHLGASASSYLKMLASSLS
jgi:hypothetical protein